MGCVQGGRVVKSLFELNPHPGLQFPGARVLKSPYLPLLKAIRKAIGTRFLDCWDIRASRSVTTSMFL